MDRIRLIFFRLWSSSVGWSWCLNGLRLGSSFLLLPLLLRLPTPDYGMYFVLLSLQAVVPLLDLGFLPSIDRAIGYAMGGARELQSQGMATAGDADGKPNNALLWKLLHVTRTLYRWLAIGTLVILGGWGTYVVALGVGETSDRHQTWLAWILTLASAVFEMYSGWWSIYLRSLNRVLLYTRILVLAFLIKLFLSCGFLVAGLGLLSVPLAGLVSSSISRALARANCLRFFAGQSCLNPAAGEVRSMLSTLWPNSWRMGLHYLSGYLTSNANQFLCLKFLGLAVNAPYGLSLQIVNICQAMASSWLQVKWPLFTQLRVRNELDLLRSIFRSRVWLVAGTYAFMAVSALLIGQRLLDWLPGGKHLLSWPWFPILLGAGLLELQYVLWGTLLATGNRAPFVIPSLLTSALSLILVISMLKFTHLKSGALVLGPLIAGCAFNYWYWPREGARSVGTSWFRFLFFRTR
jgi:O-antigen/teichoic acid export membrane protein